MYKFSLLLLVGLCFNQSLFISEYGEGSSYNKYIEIYNPTSNSEDLSGYQLWKITNGVGDWESANSLDLSGNLASNDVYVICHSSIDEQIASLCDLLIGSQSVNFNGDDAVGLAYNNEVIDQIGDQGDDPGSGWEVAGVGDATKDHTLVRKSEVTSGNTTWSSSAGTSSDNSEWEVYEQDTWNFMGWHIEGGGDLVSGCTDPNATNYNSDANVDDGSCEYNSTALTISQIQGQADASPYVGQMVSTSGIVTGVASYGFFLQDGSGPWSGIWVYGGADNLVLGDEVTVSGIIVEYACDDGCLETLTEIEAMDVEVSSSGNSLPEPIILASGDVDESYESVLLSITGECVTEPDNYGAWQLDDGSGAVSVDDKLFPEADELVQLGNQYTIIGPLDFSYDEFELAPRSEDDIIEFVPEGVPVADAGDDQIVDFSESVILDGTGSFDTDGNIIGYSWTQISGPSVDIDNYEQAVISFIAPDEFCVLEFSLQVFDDSFNFSSPDHLTITVGSLGIYDIQYTTEQGQYCYETEMSGLDVTVTGVVTHVKPGGQFFLQDFSQDFWSGIYVYDTTVNPSRGDELIISASVNEYYSFTQLLDVTDWTVLSEDNDIISASVNASDIGIECSESGEMYESMLVTMSDIEFDSIDEHDVWTVSDGSDLTMVDSYYFDDSSGSWPSINPGDTFDCITGVVAYSYSQFKVYPRDINDFLCYEEDCASGDINGDGYIDVLDVVATVNFILGTYDPNDNEFCAADYNGDGYIDVLDVVSIVSIILG